MSTSPTRLKIAWIGAFTLALLCIGTGTGHAADVEAGKAIATKGNDKGVPPCSACHGANGEGQATSGIPRLAGLNAAYLQGQLAAFGIGTRDNAMMSPIAKTMDATSMAAAAAFYASLPAPEASARRFPRSPGSPPPMSSTSCRPGRRDRAMTIRSA